MSVASTGAPLAVLSARTMSTTSSGRRHVPLGMTSQTKRVPDRRLRGNHEQGEARHWQRRRARAAQTIDDLRPPPSSPAHQLLRQFRNFTHRARGRRRAPSGAASSSCTRSPPPMPWPERRGVELVVVGERCGGRAARRGVELVVAAERGGSRVRAPGRQRAAWRRAGAASSSSTRSPASAAASGAGQRHRSWNIDPFTASYKCQLT